MIKFPEFKCVEVPNHMLDDEGEATELCQEEQTMYKLTN